MAWSNWFWQEILLTIAIEKKELDSQQWNEFPVLKRPITTQPKGSVLPLSCDSVSQNVLVLGIISIDSGNNNRNVINLLKVNNNK